MRKLAFLLMLLVAFAGSAAAEEILLEQGFEYVFPPLGWTLESTSTYTWASC
ncbi:MAG TPA: hypothetical protein PK961_04840 [bacterium]|nr:hypothetical protein [bacterium]